MCPKMVFAAELSRWVHVTKEPVLCFYVEPQHPDDPSWVNFGGDFVVHKLGLDDEEEGIWVFASEHKDLVETWIMGAESALKMIEGVCKS